MSLVTYSELRNLVDLGVVTGVPSGNINGASIDVTLNDLFFVEQSLVESGYMVHLAHKQTPNMIPMRPEPGSGLILMPGQFCLAATREIFNLPNYIALEFKLKSSVARAGLNHLMAGWGDPTWHGSALTLELKNELAHHALVLEPGMKIGQVVFWKGEEVPTHATYAVRGQYNGNDKATPSKGVR